MFEEDYEIVESYTLGDFKETVNLYIDQGYEPLGGMNVIYGSRASIGCPGMWELKSDRPNSITFVQSMIKKSK